jgi:antagonist of KipI
MSIKIIKPGILDSLQDAGRYGYRHMGINPTGAMDTYAAAVANFLVGNESGEAVIEMHFPASVFLFEQPAIIALSGADFTASINGERIFLYRPIMVSKNSILQFHKQESGARCYLAVRGGFNIVKWLSSAGTNLKANAGGWKGRQLIKDDTISFREEYDYTRGVEKSDLKILSWKADEKWENENKEISVLPGNEWTWLTDQSKERFSETAFFIRPQSDRMGYRLSGEPLQTTVKEELISSAVCFGTLQLLPGGSLILLMADHQTTGGYPRVAHVITAHHSKLAQMKPGEKLYFRITDSKTAEKLLLKQQQHLLQLQNACKFRLENFLRENN